MIDEIADRLAFWRRRYRASQRMLARALYENRVHAACLEIATKVLKQYTGARNAAARRALVDIKTRLAELETNNDEV